MGRTSHIHNRGNQRNICITNLSYIRTYEADEVLLPRIEKLCPSPDSDEPIVCVCNDNESELQMTSEVWSSADWKVEPFTGLDALEHMGTRARNMLCAEVLLDLLT